MLAIFMNVLHPEFNVLDFLVPYLVAGILGLVMAWLIVALLERLRLARHVGNVSLFFIALAALLAGLTDWWLNL
jgi:Co/Zn/Cd efflux system component